ISKPARMLKKPASLSSRSAILDSFAMSRLVPSGCMNGIRPSRMKRIASAPNRSFQFTRIRSPECAQRLRNSHRSVPVGAVQIFEELTLWGDNDDVALAPDRILVRLEAVIHRGQVGIAAVCLIVDRCGTRVGLSALALRLLGGISQNLRSLQIG